MGKSMESLQPVRGTRDLLPNEFRVHKMVSDLACSIAARYGFQEVDTPIFEFTEVFARTLGDTSDIVTKEMYTFLDKNGASITLRPEYTAGIVRMLLSNSLLRNLPIKVFGRGPMFRYERPQKGRQRQFHQINIELIGVPGPIADIEVISLAQHFLSELGINDLIKLELNTLGDADSRQRYRGCLVEYFSDHQDKLSKESIERLKKNPLRILDSKSKEDQVLISDAPTIEQSLNPESVDFFSEVKDGLSKLGISFSVNPRLVRGMDYYCHSTFEFVTKDLGAQGAVLAGGRYDGLVEAMGGTPTPGIGWAGGIERLALLATKEPEIIMPIAVIPVGEAAHQTAYKITNYLRRNNFTVHYAFSGNFKKRLSRANSLSAKAAIIIGEDELAKNTLTIRDMKTGEQTETIFASLLDRLVSFR